MKNLCVLCIAMIMGTPFAFSESQLNQDKYIIDHIFKSKENGVFVDIGANDGVTQSNTLLFEKRYNWSGICIEPIKSTYEKLKKHRKCILVNAAISDKEGKEVFIEHPCSLVSGLDTTYHAKHRKRWNMNKRGRKYTVDCITLNALAEKYSINEIDLLDIDTEGSEFMILKSIDFSKVKIHAILIENHYNKDLIQKYLKTKNFSFVCRIKNDEIYLNNASEYSIN